MAKIDDDEDRLATKRQRSTMTSKDDEPRKREKRSERERKERRKLNKEPLVNINFFFFGYNPATMSCY